MRTPNLISQSLIWVSFLTTPALALAERPNVVLILADDLGINDLACYGRSDHRTPHLDRLASEGLRFTSAYCSQPICSPTRAALMTGKTPARLHLTTFLPGRADAPSQRLLHPRIEKRLPQEAKTIAERFKESGYTTGCVGKWHLGEGAASPRSRGFDVVHPGRANTVPTEVEGGKGEFDLTGAAEKFLVSNRSRPFFLFLSHNNPHIPLGAGAELIRDNRDAFNPTYAAMIETLDRSVGRLLGKLDSLGLRERTIVVFTSDNGGLHVPELDEDPPTHNTPYRAGKGFLYEGGLRIPLIVRWPGFIAGGRTTTTPVISTDWAPTLMEICEMAPDPSLDGRSIVSCLKGGELSPRPLFWHFPHYSNQGSRPSGAVREGDWKLIEHYEDGRRELFNLARDPGERTDTSAEHAELVNSLAGKLDGWRKSVDAQGNRANPKFDPALHRKLYMDVDVSRLLPAMKASEMRGPLRGWRSLMDSVVKPTPKMESAVRFPPEIEA